MIICHLPAGFLAALASKRLGAGKPLLWGILAGSILPDLDMIWFLFVDGGTVHHHTYITHRPAIWAGVLAAGLGFRQTWITGIGLGALLHMCLDSIVGSISWGWPFSDHATTLVVVPATHDFWLHSFLFHWTFQVEITIAVTALAALFWHLRHGK